MAQRSHDTVRLAGVVFAVFVSTVLLAVCHVLNQDLDQQKRASVQAQRAAWEVKARAQALTLERQALRELVVGNNAPLLGAGVSHDGLLADANATFQRITAEGWITRQDRSEVRDPEVQAIWDRMLEQRGDPEHFRSLVQLSAELPEQLRAVLHVVPRLRVQRIRAREEAIVLIDQTHTVRAELDREVDELRVNQKQASDDARALARRSARKLALLRGENGRNQDALARVHGAHRSELAGREVELTELRLKLAQLKRKAEADARGGAHVVVFLGARPRSSTYTRSELERKATEAGWTVADEVTIDTDAVVLLSDDEPGYRARLRRAASFGVTFVREDRLLEYMKRGRPEGWPALSVRLR